MDDEGDPPVAASATVILSRWGATSDEWDGLCSHHGLTEDLLPVVSNPKAKVADYSTLQAVGKVPSRYNADGEVVGFAKWTEKRATRAEVTRWSGEPDYGICVQTRRLRAIDVDIEDGELARQVLEVIEDTVGGGPMRTRQNSPKFLLPFWMEGHHPKRILRLGKDRGIIEFLGNGQQFIAAGTHPSGARYQWGTETDPEQIPDAFLPLEPDEFEALWLRLRDAFQAEDERSTTTKPRLEALSEAASNDPVAAWLHEQGRVLDIGRDGQLFTPCPNAAEHTTDSGPTATAYYPANTGGYAQGHWKCLHAHCANKPDSFFTQLLDMVEYPDLSLEVEDPAADLPVTERAERFTPVSAADFLAGGDSEAWLVKHVMPAAGLVTIFGPSGAGKSFAVIDMACHVAMGRMWQGRRVTQARVVYLAAEGQGGIRRRLRAWCRFYGVDPKDLPLDIITARPNMLERADVVALHRAIRRAGMVVIDTAMAVTQGGDENSSEDMGRLMAFAALLGEGVEGVIVMVHHAGKDVGRGQRGWSGLKGAVDTELEVTKDDFGHHQIRLSKVRDGPLEGFTWAFGLEDVVLGHDADGDPITSAVPVYTEVVARAAPGPKLTPREKHVMLTITNLTALGDEVTVPEVRRLAARGLPAGSAKEDAAAKAAAGTEEKAAPNASRDVKRVLEKLRAEGLITILDNVITIE
jgi:hypothetical protein